MFIFPPQEVLSDMFGVQGIPSFVVLGADGKVVTTEGRGKVEADPTGASFPAGWLPQPINDVNDDPGPLNEETCFLVFAPSEASAAAITAVAKETHAAAGGVIDDMPCQFFTAKDGGVMPAAHRAARRQGPAGDPGYPGGREVPRVPGCGRGNARIRARDDGATQGGGAGDELILPVTHTMPGSDACMPTVNKFHLYIKCHHCILSSLHPSHAFIQRQGSDPNAKAKTRITSDTGRETQTQKPKQIVLSASPRHIVSTVGHWINWSSVTHSRWGGEDEGG